MSPKGIICAAMGLIAATGTQACETSASNDRLFSYCLVNEAFGQTLSAGDVVFLSTQLESVGQDRLINVTKVSAVRTFGTDLRI